MGSIILMIIVFSILISVFVFCIIMLATISEAKGRAKKTMKELEKQLETQGVTIYTAFYHVNGLPISENSLCQIFSFPDKLEFKFGTTNIILARNKITDMCINTDVEIQNQIVSSVGGAIAGGVMFGTLGAIIGGRAKTKKVRTVTRYLIITYIDNQGDLKYIGFDIKNDFSSACKLVDEFKALTTSSGVQIEL